MGIRSYLWVAKKKPGFWGPGGGWWGKETGIKVVNITAIFSASKPQIPVGAKHSGRQIIAENINLNTAWASPYRSPVRKKTAVGVICGMRERNPVSGVLGLAVGRKKPGFWGGYQELSVGSGKETRFLGFWGWLVGQRNRVSGVGIKSYL